MLKIIRIVLPLSILVAPPLAAHHSFAAIDRQSEAFVRGTVTEFQFRNPHTFIFVDVPQEDGQAASWRIEGETRNDLYRNGWRDDSLQPGDAVTVHVQPARDPARRYARLLSVEKADGTVLAIPNEEDERGRYVEAAAESLEGVWLPVQTFAEVGAKLRSLANEKARAELAQQTGLPPNAECVDMAIPMRLGRAHVYEIEFASDDLILIHGEDDAEPRRVYLDGRDHPDSIPEEEQSWTGHSIGHWEGDTLVIDTRHFKYHPGINGIGPAGSQKHLVERFTLSEDGTQIVIDFVLEDPEYLSDSVSHTYRWQHSPHITRLPYSCDLESAQGFLVTD